MQTEVEGIILKETKYGETSKILQVLTKEYGLISLISKGSLSIKSKLRSISIPFLYGKFKIIYKKNKISILTDGEVYKIYGFNVNDIKMYAYISYLCELTYNVLKENNDSTIFEILRDALDKIIEGFDKNVIKNIVEFKYLDYIGITPNFDVCSICYKDKEFYAIDGKNGGFICRDCYTNERIVPPNFKNILKRFQNVDIKSIQKIRLKEEDSKLVNEFIVDYYQKYSAVYINSLKFLSEIK